MPKNNLARAASSLRELGPIRLTSLSTLLLSSLVIGAATALLFALARVIRSARYAFDNDEANHALNGWELYLALLRWEPIQITRALSDQAFYPPVHSLFVAASYFLHGGASLAASRLPSLVNFALVLGLLVGLILWLTHSDPTQPPAKKRVVWAGAMFALGLAITSEVLIIHATLIMLEMTGALMGLLLLCAIHFWATCSRRITCWLALGGVALFSVAICLTKYSFGLFFLPALLAGVFFTTPPWRIPRQRWVDFIALFTLIAGCLVGWAYFSHSETIGLFFVDHPSYSERWSSENLLYLPNIWLKGYSSTPLWGIIALVLAVCGVFYHWHQLAIRVASLAILAASVILTISTTDEPRHSLPVAPLIWLLAGLGLNQILYALPGWLQQTRSPSALAKIHPDHLLSTLLVVLFAGLALGAFRLAPRLSQVLAREFETDLDYILVQDYALAHVEPQQPTLLLGDFDDQFNLLALRWRAASQYEQSHWDLQLDYFPFEHHESSLARTRRKPQIATVDPTFPRQHMNEILARRHFAQIIEFKQRANYFGPRAANPDDPLCGYPAVEKQFTNWVVTIYQNTAASAAKCHP